MSKGGYYEKNLYQKPVYIYDHRYGCCRSGYFRIADYCY